MFLQNLHTHTNYCDGKDTPEEMITCALEKGFNSIGFSEHSYTAFSPMCVKIGDNTEEYKKEVASLKKKYKDRLKIYLGLEVEMYDQTDMTGYDYLIGSVHYLKVGGEFVGFDGSDEDVVNVINNYFGGDGMKYAKAYYEALSQLPEFGNFDIIGHFDLITKHCEKRSFFDTSSKEYLNAAFSAAEALKGKVPFFEVNTGAIARGYRTTPYPFPDIIKELKRLGFGVVITSDCHNKNMLDCNMSEATELLKSCGFTEKYILTDNGFEAIGL